MGSPAAPAGSEISAELPLLALSPLQDLRAKLYGSDDDLEQQTSRELFAYARSNGLDLGRLWTERLIAMRIMKIRWFAGPRFDFAEQYSSAAVVIEAFDVDEETVVDLVAWNMDRPEKFGTALGRAAALGLGAVTNPATFHLGQPLPVHRTPLSWLQHGCSGCVVLDRLSAPRWLGEAPGSIAAEDVEHGRELARLLHPYFPPSRVLVPQLRGAAA